MEEELKKIEAYAKENHVPIMEEEGITFLTNYIKEHDIKTILEIGTAIGYSAIKMALVDPEIQVTTIERDETRYEEAIQNINTFKLHDRIELIYSDAFDVVLNKKYDMIFIDAAKAQYQKFFEKFKENLNEHGYIISDNLNFHGLTHTLDRIESKNLRSLVRKINDYVLFLENNEEFETIFYQVGDGVGVSKRKDG